MLQIQSTTVKKGVNNSWDGYPNVSLMHRFRIALQIEWSCVLNSLTISLALSRTRNDSAINFFFFLVLSFPFPFCLISSLLLFTVEFDYNFRFFNITISLIYLWINLCDKIFSNVQEAVSVISLR